MAQIQKGLRPDPLARPKMGGRVKSRVEVAMPDPQPRLGAVASPVDTYVRPEQQRGGDDMLALAQGLAALNPALSAYAQQAEASGREKADADARMKLAGMTFEEATAAVKEGRMAEMESPWFKAAFMRQYGTRYALWRANERTEVYANEFDRENGDLEAFLAEGADEDAQAFGNDEFFRAGYGEAYTRFADNLRAKHGEYQTGRIKEETVSGASARFLDVAHAGIEQGLSPAQINEQLRGLYQGNKDLLFLTPKEQDLIMLGVSEQLANEGRYDLVKEILTSDRGGVGSIVNKSAVSADAYKLLRFAEGVKRDQDNKALSDTMLRFNLSSADGTLDEGEVLAVQQAYPDAFSAESAASLINRNRSVREQAAKEFARVEAEREIVATLDAQDRAVTEYVRQAGDNGQLAFLSDLPTSTKEDIKEGRPGSKVVSADDLRKRAVTDYMETRSDAIQQKNGETDEQRFQREVQWLTRNGVTYDKWETILSTGYQNVTASSVAGNDTALFQQSFGLYERLHATAPSLAGKLVKDKSAIDLYETVRVAKQDMGLTAEQAAIAASAVMHDPTKMQEVSARYRQDQVLAAVSNVKNKGEIAGEMEKMVKVFVGLGMAPDKAISRAKERIDQTYTKVNGRLLYTADRDIPPDFAELAEDYLSAYAESLPPDEALDGDDLSLMAPTSAKGVFVIVDAATGIPVANNPYITVTQLNAVRAVRDTAERERAAAQAAADSAARLDPIWVFSRDTYIGSYDHSPEGKAETQRRVNAIMDAREAEAAKRANDPNNKAINDALGSMPR